MFNQKHCWVQLADNQHNKMSTLVFYDKLLRINAMTEKLPHLEVLLCNSKLLPLHNHAVDML